MLDLVLFGIAVFFIGVVVVTTMPRHKHCPKCGKRGWHVCSDWSNTQLRTCTFCGHFVWEVEGYDGQEKAEEQNGDNENGNQQRSVGSEE